MAKKPSRPKFGKKPKAGASADTIANYMKKCDEKVREYKKKLSAWSSEKTKKAALRKKLATYKPKI